jgi:MraZ protein
MLVEKNVIMFIGEYQHNLDEKGRLAIPVKFREQLKKGAVATKGLDNCLFLYPKDEWKKEADKVSKLPTSQAKARAYARHTLAGAMEMDFDNQGRITLPEYLREFAGLKKKVIIAGLYNRVEIWNESAWEKFKLESDKDSNQIAESLGELGV